MYISFYQNKLSVQCIALYLFEDKSNMDLFLFMFVLCFCFVLFPLMCDMLTFQSKCARCWIFSQNVRDVEFSVKMCDLLNFQSKFVFVFEVSEQSQSAREGGKNFLECILIEISQWLGLSCNLCLCLRFESKCARCWIFGQNVREAEF